MKRITISLGIAVAIIALAALPSRRAVADDETDDIEIKIVAPLDAAACDAVPPTISVLGLTIDISHATIDANSDGSDDGDCGDNCDGGGPGATGCAALTVGQTVEVKFASDGTPLAATEVNQDGSEEDVVVRGPIQSVDTTAETVTALGLTIDVSGADMAGAYDDDTEGDSGPIDITQLIAGQFVEIELDATQLPDLVATSLDLKNATNEADVEVDDQNGNPIEDADDDVTVDVDETVTVTPPPASGAASPTVRPRRVRLHFHATSNGRFTLTGLPTGRAKITVTRVTTSGKSRASKSVVVHGNATATTRVRLRPVRGR